MPPRRALPLGYSFLFLVLISSSLLPKVEPHATSFQTQNPSSENPTSPTIDINNDLILPDDTTSSPPLNGSLDSSQQEQQPQTQFDFPPSPLSPPFISLSAMGVTAEQEFRERPGQPKGMTFSQTTSERVYRDKFLKSVRSLGWDIGFSTITNGRGYPNEDNILISIFTKPAPDQTDGKRAISGAQAVIPNIGVFAVADGHGRFGYKASGAVVSALSAVASQRFSNSSSVPGPRVLLRHPVELNGHLNTESRPLYIQSTISEMFLAADLSTHQYGGSGVCVTLALWDAVDEKVYVVTIGDSPALGKLRVDPSHAFLPVFGKRSFNYISREQTDNSSHNVYENDGGDSLMTPDNSKYWNGVDSTGTLRELGRRHEAASLDERLALKEMARQYGLKVRKEVRSKFMMKLWYEADYGEAEPIHHMNSTDLNEKKATGNSTVADLLEQRRLIDGNCTNCGGGLSSVDISPTESQGDQQGSEEQQEMVNDLEVIGDGSGGDNLGIENAGAVMKEIQRHLPAEEELLEPLGTEFAAEDQGSQQTPLATDLVARQEFVPPQVDSEDESREDAAVNSAINRTIWSHEQSGVTSVDGAGADTEGNTFLEVATRSDSRDAQGRMDRQLQQEAEKLLDSLSEDNKEVLPKVKGIPVYPYTHTGHFQLYYFVNEGLFIDNRLGICQLTRGPGDGTSGFSEKNELTSSSFARRDPEVTIVDGRSLSGEGAYLLLITDGVSTPYETMEKSVVRDLIRSGEPPISARTGRTLEDPWPLYKKWVEDPTMLESPQFETVVEEFMEEASDRAIADIEKRVAEKLALSGGNAQEAMVNLVKEAYILWIEEYGNSMDDTTALYISFSGSQTVKAAGLQAAATSGTFSKGSCYGWSIFLLLLFV